MSHELKVMQADRDAAADVASSFGAEQVPPEMRAGKLDHHPTVQAFARHRIATETQSQAAIDELVGGLEEAREALHWIGGQAKQAMITSAGCATTHGDPGGGLEDVNRYASDIAANAELTSDKIDALLLARKEDGNG